MNWRKVNVVEDYFELWIVSAEIINNEKQQFDVWRETWPVIKIILLLMEIDNDHWDFQSLGVQARLRREETRNYHVSVSI